MKIKKDFIGFIYKYRKRVAFIIGILIVILGIVLNYTYRQYIYRNSVNDFHLADTIGSWLCVPAASFLFFGISSKASSVFKILVQVTIANMIYELFSITRYHGVFDPFDVLAILMGSLITFLVIKYFKTLF